jgi:N-acetylglucosamine-6-phosphate deacetylase
MHNLPLKIYNGPIVTPHRIIHEGTIIVSDGKIAALSEEDIEVQDAEKIDANGNYISPGFIDIHIHGGGGSDFMDGDQEAFLTVANMHARYGTTSMFPTSLAGHKEEILKTLSGYEKANENNRAGSQFLGMHLEGPYLAMNQRGAQDPRYIRAPDPEEYKDIIDRFSIIKRWSAAPELNGALEFGRYLRSREIIAAIAHTDATYEEVVEAFENGYSLITHLYSGMSGLIRRNAFRYAGVIESAYLMDGIDVELIADGVHLPPPLLKLAYKIKGANSIALITDAMRAAGMPPGESILGSVHEGIKVIVEDGVAKLPDRSAFAGSVATADCLVRNMINLADVPFLDAVKMMTSSPARIMKVDDCKGSLVPGKDADIIIFDKNIKVKTTIIKGKVIYSEK